MLTESQLDLQIEVLRRNLKSVYDEGKKRIESGEQVSEELKRYVKSFEADQDDRKSTAVKAFTFEITKSQEAGIMSGSTYLSRLKGNL